MEMNIIHKIKQSRDFIDRNGSYYFSRRRAHKIRNELIRQRGYKVVNHKTKRSIKAYAKDTFGSKSFWPWLALYTEIRGEFIEGWLPDDYYTVNLLKKLNAETAKICNYKSFDYRIFPDFSLKPVISIISGSVLNSSGDRIEFSEARKLLDDCRREIVVKEDSGKGGSNVLFIDSVKLDLNQLSKNKSYIIQPALKQHELLGRINPRSVNTIRVFTYQKKNGGIVVKFAYFRFGSGESRVDNSSSGGGMCKIKNSGYLDEIAYDKSGMALGDQNPQTGMRYSSVKIPAFNEILEKCIQSHEKYRYLRFIGWDVAVNSEGKPVLLEWNSEPNLWKAEALYGPYWLEELKKQEI